MSGDSTEHNRFTKLATARVLEAVSSSGTCLSKYVFVDPSHYMQKGTFILLLSNQTALSSFSWLLLISGLIA